MANVFTLTCPSCGGKLKITSDLERFACAHCGNEHTVRRSGSVVSLSPVVESLNKVQAGVDKTASELAIRRLREDIDNLNTELENITTHQVRRVQNGLGVTVIGIALLISGGLFTNFLLLSILGVAVIVIGVNMLSSGIRMSEEEKSLKRNIREKQAQLRQHEKTVSR